MFHSNGRCWSTKRIFFVKQQTTITLEGIIDNENVSTFRKYGWPHPPGTEGGGCGEAGL